MKRGWIWILALLVIAALLVPLITLNGARSRIQASLDASLGRRVEADAVHLHLLPVPGIELDHVRLSENPAFGYEDMVVADSALASIRLLPLLEGRLVFARVNLEGASINLVRNGSGRWNIAALLDRTNQPSQGAGRAARGAGIAQPFPYLEWNDARINFKLEQTKSRFYLDQVSGSLAHDRNGWRLQARFQPQRTDLNLSNTGDVTLDGRWPDSRPMASGPGAFRSRPFDVVLRLRNSYLAGSSALVVGHDAGVHGVLAAQVDISGSYGGAAPHWATEPELQIHGSLQIQSLRRWDLLPPPATVEAAFAGSYDPAEDVFRLADLGDPGWKHIRVAGEVNNVFTHPAIHLGLSLDQYPAADLLPLVMAVKANLPRDLAAAGSLSGTASVSWARGTEPKSTAQLEAEGLRISSGDRTLLIPRAELVSWRDSLRALPTPARLSAPGLSAPAPLSLSGRLSPEGFEIGMTSAALPAPAWGALATLAGVGTPWPAELDGVASIAVQLGAPWESYTQPQWSGSASLAQARFKSPDGAEMALEDVHASFAGAGLRQIRFSADAMHTGRTAASGAKDPQMTGSVEWEAAAKRSEPMVFSLQVPQVSLNEVERLMAPQPESLPQSLWQRLIGEQPRSPAGAWLNEVRGTGTLRIADLTMGGIHAGVRVQLEAGPEAWRAPGIEMRLAEGTIRAEGELEEQGYRFSGATVQPLLLSAILAHTPLAGMAQGWIAGTVQHGRIGSVPRWTTATASGTFAITRGSLRTAHGPASFQRFSGQYELDHGAIELTKIRWENASGVWVGQGRLTLAGPKAGFDLQLHQEALATREATQWQVTGPLELAQP